MSDADYRIDGLESRIGDLEGKLDQEISSERYETEREVSSVEGRLRDLEEVIRMNADATREIRIEELETTQELRDQLAKLLEAGQAVLDRIEGIESLTERLERRWQSLMLLEERVGALDSLLGAHVEAANRRLDELEKNLVETDERVLNLESAVNETRNDVETVLALAHQVEDRVEKLEELDRETTDARVDVNRRLDLIEADVIYLSEETHKRITAILNGSLADLKNDLATLALRCGITDGRSRVKLSVDRGKEGGS